MITGGGEKVFVKVQVTLAPAEIVMLDGVFGDGLQMALVGIQPGGRLDSDTVYAPMLRVKL
jgi:hypothetical protein